MKSGLEGRNNRFGCPPLSGSSICLNEVRPRRPEQYAGREEAGEAVPAVSMKSGLEGRNNLLDAAVS